LNNFSNKTVCIVDNGLFVTLAETLAKKFGKTLYYSPWEQSFPRSNDILVGEGLPGVTRISSIWPVIDDVDLFVFPDIFHGPLQVYLRKQGKRVWGGMLGENLEIIRGLGKRWIKDAGLEVGPWRQIKSLDKLRDYLKENEDQYVKIPRTRGDMETFHSPSYKLIEPRLDELEHTLGAKKHIQEFIVEAPIEPAIEVGYDGYVIDGKYPQTALYGVEVKDTAYLGQVVPYHQLPAGAQEVNKRLAGLFADWTYRGFFSSEIRIKGGKPYLIDPCCRMASPPGELYQVMMTNLADILWHGAMGDMVEPEFEAKWGAQLVMRSSWATHNWLAIDFPASIREHVKISYQTKIQGRTYFIPQPVEIAEFGSVVAMGDSADDAIANVKKISEKIEAYGLKFEYSALDSAKVDMEKLKAAA
jgi:hypothetical protein